MAIRIAHDSWTATERLLARLFMFLNAIVLFATGFALLTSPLYIPLTVALWLGAAAIVALGILTPLKE